MLSTTMAPLGRYPRWINWSLEADPHRPEKPRKVPRNPRTGYGCKPQDPAAWCTYEEALASAQARGHGLGFVFQEGDGLFFLDLDNCVDPATGTWNALAQHLMTVWDGHAAIEVSQSGKGLHIFGYASSIPEHGCRNIALGLELYHHDRFVAFTDYQSTGAIDADVSLQLKGVVDAYFPKTATSRDVVDWCDEGDGATADDRDLMQIMMHSKSNASTFGDKATFAELFTGNEDALGKAFPTQNGHDAFDRSAADSALASLLIYWCGGNLERVERFMRQSALAREKWDDRPDYLETTIIKAAGIVTNRATKREVGAPLTTGMAATVDLEGNTVASAPTPGAPRKEMGERAGATILSASEQRQYFAGCVYLQVPNRVWSPAVGLMLDKARMDVIYGGRSFVLTPDGKLSKSAWDAFTLSQLNEPLTARDTCFKPHLPPGRVTHDGLLNTYLPVATEETPGDASKWLTHLAKLFPDAEDRAIITSYLARIVRSPGVKAQWWPVVQGCQGNGKSLLNLVMQFAIGEKYSHQARASALAKTGMQFNAWVMGKLYLGVEEIQVSDKRHFLEDFKDIVTNTTAAIEAKGQDQRTGDNYLNGLMLTNHRDAVPITEEDRRYAIFYTPQQHKADLARDGMTGSYFPDLYDWLYGRNAYEELGVNYGFRVVNWWLRNVATIEARYDVAGECQRAPRTTATAEAVVESRGLLEQDILLRASMGEPGFAGGWVSSSALDTLLNIQRVRLPHTKRLALMDGLGYQLHHALEGGLTHRGTGGQAGRTMLWLRAGHPALQLHDPEAIVQAYERAQGIGPAGAGNSAAQALLAK